MLQTFSVQLHKPRLPAKRAVTLCSLIVTASFLISPVIAASGDFSAIAKPFIEQHCMSCHNEEKSKAGFRVDLLHDDFSAPKVADEWKEVIDRINTGEMPPEEEPKPDVESAAAFVTWVNQQLHQVELKAKNAGGRIPMRRLNRDEYLNSIRDLLHLDKNLIAPLTDELPGDGKAEGFDRLGVALFFDQSQIERSLALAEKIAAIAIVTQQPKVNTHVEKFGVLRAKPPSDKVEVFPAFKHTIPQGAHGLTIHPDFVEYLQGGPTYVSGSPWGAITHFSVSRSIETDGYYRIRIKAKVDNRGRSIPNRFRMEYGMGSPIQVESELPVDPSGVTETTLFLRGRSNGEALGPQVFRLLWNHNENAVITEPKYKSLVSQWTRMRGILQQAAVKRVPEAEMNALRQERSEIEKALNAWKGPAHIFNPTMDIDQLARLQIEAIEIEGPIQKEWPPKSHQTLFFDGDVRQDLNYAKEIFTQFLPFAYRRTVEPEEVDAIVAVVKTAQTAEKLSFHEAMRIGLQRVLCSPGFLFLDEPAGDSPKPRPLTDFELASRLSYFLWSSMPDRELFSLAAKGRLRDPSVRQAQVERMMDDPKSDQLVRNFAGQWLEVRDYNSVEPAADYKNYDNALKLSSLEEPYAFFSEVYQKDLPITSFINSDFVVINERLARHYGIDGVSGPEFRRVSIQPQHHRGGVLGMAGLMTYLSDGTRTLPMRRGTWVLRELFNDPPNDPPPNAGEIQPNTAGENLTVRERIELHRKDEICASCHSKLDPYGLALENYDAIGQWRERANGEGFHASKAPMLDVRGSFPDGKSFSSLEEYKEGLLAHRDKFARAFAAKMLTYALGRPVGFTDHQEIEKLSVSLKTHDYRIRSLISGIVASEPFNTK